MRRNSCSRKFFDMIEIAQFCAAISVRGKSTFAEKSANCAGSENKFCRSVKIYQWNNLIFFAAKSLFGKYEMFNKICFQIWHNF